MATFKELSAKFSKAGLDLPAPAKPVVKEEPVKLAGGDVQKDLHRAVQAAVAIVARKYGGTPLQTSIDVAPGEVTVMSGIEFSSHPPDEE